MTQQATRQRPTASEKACTKCGHAKALEAFSADRRNSNGLRGSCKECDAVWRIKWRAENRDRHLEICRAYYQKNRGKALATLRARYANDPEYRARDIASSRKWREDNPERRHEHAQERLAARSSRVRRIRKLIDHFEGRDVYLTHIAHIVDARPDAQGLQWLCRRIDGLVAEHVYGEV